MSVDHGITIQETPDAVVSSGDLTYTMTVTVGELGGNTEVLITPNHGFDQLAPRLAREEFTRQLNRFEGVFEDCTNVCRF